MELFSAYVVARIVRVQVLGQAWESQFNPGGRRAALFQFPVKRDTVDPINLDPLERIGTEGSLPMIHIAGKASKEDSRILHAAVGLGSQIRAASEEIEQGCRIPPTLAAAMKGAGVFGMVMPRAWGGPELDPMTQFRVIEALAMVDGSVGWCAMIGCDAGYISAFLDQDVARAMFPDLLSAMGAAATPTGTATVVPGGYRVSGRFPFVSGCHHREWLWLGCHVVEDGASRMNSTGVPETRQCLLRLEKCEILDTWYTTGLRGTGSNDVAVHDQFVPDEQSFSFQDPELVKRSGPLYAFPFMFAAKGPAVALGIARHALDELIEASGKPARRYTLGEGVEPPKLCAMMYSCRRPSGGPTRC